ncbi:MAG: 16S rRNA (cytidine(1402)-2'-O)-methyltransferase [Candidatus Pelagibacter sp. TMED64]|nr:16S rRNA (cytidine(1402)-2'-O)-methyltransferase [Candidatus Pelagibacter sp.]OUU65510.1 MAG: 16S rRNA (cytidine(1402)-2'-O)-methyltransferase [Candidatus Pelagibacter sp. TMED64]|tara:strand:+ start:1748 stop:2602 length:855 start_codon:yes stop_codon:yes gene_type:complete
MILDKSKKIISGLYIVSTPIGNLEDITFRAINVLTKSDIILCEDTRRSYKLLSHYKIKKKLISYHKFNEKKMLQAIINLIEDKKIVSLISDAGTPSISDPGALIVKECIDKGINIFPIPGPSAVTAAISASGFEGKYVFFGFLPKKISELERIFKNLVNLDYSLVFFISAKKINFYIEYFKIYFSNRNIFIAREMTKIYESYISKKVDFLSEFPENFKGELTIVLSKPFSKKNNKDLSESVKIKIKKMLKKYSHKDVVDFVSKNENLPKNIIYKYCLKIKKYDE